MNTHNNKRKQNSVKKFKEAFMALVKKKDLQNITVSEICSMAKLNRTTFYASFDSLNDLIESIKNDYKTLFIHKIKTFINDDYYFLNLFEDIYHNQLFYKMYFKLFSDNGLKSDFINELLFNKVDDSREMEYRVIFFRAGLTALLNKWLLEGCKEPPELVYSYLVNEYAARKNEPSK